MHTIGVDVGGTNIEVGLVGDDHEVISRAKKNTPQDGPDAVLDVVADLVRELLENVDDSAEKSGGDQTPAAVGLGIPGVVHQGQALTVPNLPNWDGPVDLVSGLTQRTGFPVALGNDANVGLLGEWLAGAARGAENVLGVWLGTGVGGGLILQGRPFHGARGGAGEIGHIVVREGGALCSCGRRGCVEAYAGRRSMTSAVRSMIEAGRTSVLEELRLEHDKSSMTSGVWRDALEADDELAIEVFATAVDTVGVGIGAVLNVLDVDLVVIGGGLAEKLGSDLADRIETSTRPWVMRPSPDLQFRVAELGDDSGVVGAAALARALVIAG
ncbi:ROK family protein [Kineococcus sp. NBC_00420]|uniref:ROK family protein n=1 Tax=Kineococcus sp. NBC_00420 TaxID=2903564 RepID=UPI002E2207F7